MACEATGWLVLCILDIFFDNMRIHCPLEVPFSTGHGWTQRRSPDFHSGWLKGSSPLWLLVWLGYSSFRVTNRGSKRDSLFVLSLVQIYWLSTQNEKVPLCLVLSSVITIFNHVLYKDKKNTKLAANFQTQWSPVWLSVQLCIYLCQCQGINGSSEWMGIRGLHLLVAAHNCPGQKAWSNHKLT